MALHGSAGGDDQPCSRKGLIASPCVLPFAAEDHVGSWTGSSTGTAASWSPFWLAEASTVARDATPAVSAAVTLSFSEHADAQSTRSADRSLQCPSLAAEKSVHASTIDLWSLCQGQHFMSASCAASSSSAACGQEVSQHEGPTPNASKVKPADGGRCWWRVCEEAALSSERGAATCEAVTMDHVVACSADRGEAQDAESSHEAQPCVEPHAMPAPVSRSDGDQTVRRRLTRKQRVLTPDSATPRAGTCAEVPAWKLRKKAAQHYAQVQMKEQVVEGATYHDRRAVLCREFKSLPAEVQAEWVCKAAAAAPPEGDDVRPGTVAGDAEPLRAKLGDVREKVCGALLTWNGSWLKQDALVASLFAQYGSSTPALSRVLAAAGPIQALFDEFWRSVGLCALDHGVLHVSCSLELSCSDLRKRRVHFHCFGSVGSNCASLDAKALWESLQFRGAKAGHMAPCIPGSGRGSRARAVGQGHYYLQCPKEGVLLAKTNWLKNKDWHVRQSWILDLWRLRKLSHDSTRRELIACRERTQQALREVDTLEAAEYSLRTRDLLQRAMLADANLKFAPPSELERDWLSQYEAKPDGHTLRRFRFLIYEGASRSGKTERAIHWFSREKTLVVSSMNTTTPSLRSWLSGRFKAIVFDEGSWQLVALNRQLFQAGLNGVTLSQSQCNEHAYEVCLHKVPIMVTTNNFWKDCEDEEARQWICANSFFQVLPSAVWNEA